MNRQISKNQSRGAGIMKLGAKRKAEISPNKKDETKKRSGLGDITNVNKTKMTLRSSLPKSDDGEKDLKKPKQKPIGVEVKADLPRPKAKTSLPKQPQTNVETKIPKAKTVIPVFGKSEKNTETQGQVTVNSQPSKSSVLDKPISELTTIRASDLKDMADKQDESLLYSTAIQTPETASEETVAALNVKNSKLNKDLAVPSPSALYNFDIECGNDPFQVGCFAPDIFEYYKKRERKFPVKKYLDKQRELNKNMRMILVDWMVEVQENFELNHETLYLGVKMVDLFLGKVLVSRDKLQLVGTTALYIAAKFDERTPPLVDDFCYICDDAYPNKDILKMEIKMLKTLEFDIGMPLSYRFLRRYARCIKLDMQTLTFARYILETALLEYDLIDVSDSMIACACLLLALTLMGTKTAWTPALVHYTGYTFEDLFDLTYRVHNMLAHIPAQFKTIKSKYSHKLFYEVASIQIPDTLDL